MTASTTVVIASYYGQSYEKSCHKGWAARVVQDFDNLLEKDTTLESIKNIFLGEQNLDLPWFSEFSHVKQFADHLAEEQKNVETFDYDYIVVAEFTDDGIHDLHYRKGNPVSKNNHAHTSY